ncbi:MAG TPA: GAF domain-containing SpoIIE family protein phosphatase [Phycisphaerales bacterium]|nr:GAF domain-containing SpoIIE family protein phosphatase [Phycisphaerales bacterium]
MPQETVQPADELGQAVAPALVELALGSLLGPGARPLCAECEHALRDFLTDASLAALCDELCSATGAPIWLRDRSGDAVVPSDGPQGPWAFVPEAEARDRAFSLAGRETAAAAGAPLFEAPLRISTGVLGWIVMAEPAGPGGPRAARRAGMGGGGLRTALTRLATAVAEGCEAQVALRRRVTELGALYRLSSMLVRTEEVDRLLEVALALAVEVLRVDAGSIAVIEEGLDDLVIKSAQGLSPEWLRYSSALSHGGEFRKAALAGEIVWVPDLSADARVVEPERARRERLHSLLSTGLMYQGRPIGLVRLYTRAPRQFTEAERGLLRSIADQSAAAVMNARLRKLREENERVSRQMRLAADVQRRMLPRAMPDSLVFDVAARYVPSLELGGDFYDFIPLGGHLGLAIGDVVGKGVAAALLMSAVRASLRAHAQDVYEIDEVCARVNAALSGDTRDDEFATLWYAVADPVTLRLTYCNAGHNPPALLRPGAGNETGGAGPPALTELCEGGMALGIDRAQRYERGVTTLARGDVLVAYTDGLTDAVDFSGARLGKARLHDMLRRIVARQPALPAAAIVEEVFWELRQFAGLTPRPDDISLVVLRVRP